MDLGTWAGTEAGPAGVSCRFPLRGASDLDQLVRFGGEPEDDEDDKERRGASEHGVWEGVANVEANVGVLRAGEGVGLLVSTQILTIVCLPFDLRVYADLILPTTGILLLEQLRGRLELEARGEGLSDLKRVSRRDEADCLTRTWKSREARVRVKEEGLAINWRVALWRGPIEGEGRMGVTVEATTGRSVARC